MVWSHQHRAGRTIPKNKRKDAEAQRISSFASLRLCVSALKRACTKTESPNRQKLAMDATANRDARQQFAPTAAAYRRRRWQLGFAFVPLLLVFWSLIFFAPKPPGFAVAVFLIIFVGILFSKRITPKLICPVCQLDADCEIVRFCPECDSSELQVKEKDDDNYFLVWPTCKACKTELRKRKGGRVYKIRFCTRCGAYLDERGL